MTRNQLLYWQNVENERSHRAQEAETNRSNLAREAETHRSNLANEAETNRHNLATELLTKSQYDEVARHNAAVEAETFRNNYANEQIKEEQNAIGYANLGIAQQNADIGRLNAATNAFLAAETATHNRAMEGFNLLSLQQSKDLEQQRIDLSADTLDESQRHNLAAESNDRSRIAVQQQDAATRNAQLIETVRSNLAKESEMNRHNQVLEPSQIYSNYTSGTRDLLNIGNDSLNTVANLIRSMNPVALLGGAK